MTMPPPPAHQKGMVRAIVIAIALMTTAIVVILAAMVAKLIAPSDDETADAAPSEVAAPVAVSGVSPGGLIDFSAAPEVEIGLPPGARVVAAHVTGDRLTLEIETVQGDSAIYTAPLTGFDGPVRLVYRTLE